MPGFGTAIGCILITDYAALLQREAGFMMKRILPAVAIAVGTFGVGFIGAYFIASEYTLGESLGYSGLLGVFSGAGYLLYKTVFHGEMGTGLPERVDATRTPPILQAIGFGVVVTLVVTILGVLFQTPANETVVAPVLGSIAAIGLFIRAMTSGRRNEE